MKKHIFFWFGSKTLVLTVTFNTFGYAIFNISTHVPCEKAQLLNTCVFIHSLCIIKSTFASYFTQYVKNSFFASFLITDKKKESGLLLHVILKSDILVFKRFNQYRNSSHSFRTWPNLVSWTYFAEKVRRIKY